VTRPAAQQWYADCAGHQQQSRTDHRRASVSGRSPALSAGSSPGSGRGS
jgi:hypothetical protein